MILQWLYGKVRHAYNIPTKDIHVALFLTDNLKFSYDFKVSKPKRSKRLYICLVPHPPASIKGVIGVRLCKNKKIKPININIANKCLAAR